MEGEHMQFGATVESSQALPPTDGIATEVEYLEAAQRSPKVVRRELINLSRGEEQGWMNKGLKSLYHELACTKIS